VERTSSTAGAVVLESSEMVLKLETDVMGQDTVSVIWAA
jgi:hypothetical protein